LRRDVLLSKKSNIDLHPGGFLPISFDEYLNESWLAKEGMARERFLFTHTSWVSSGFQMELPLRFHSSELRQTVELNPPYKGPPWTTECTFFWVLGGGFPDVFSVCLGVFSGVDFTSLMRLISHWWTPATVTISLEEITKKIYDIVLLGYEKESHVWCGVWCRGKWVAMSFQWCCIGHQRFVRKMTFRFPPFPPFKRALATTPGQRCGPRWSSAARPASLPPPPTGMHIGESRSRDHLKLSWAKHSNSANENLSIFITTSKTEDIK